MLWQSKSTEAEHAQKEAKEVEGMRTLEDFFEYKKSYFLTYPHSPRQLAEIITFIDENPMKLLEIRTGIIHEFGDQKYVSPENSSEVGKRMIIVAFENSDDALFFKLRFYGNK